MILISAQGLGRQFTGDPIFSELEFEVRAGERIGLVGPNGAGKTTLMQILAGLDQADYGRLFVRPGIRVSSAAAGDRLRARPDPDRSRQVGARLADRSPARARRSRPGNGRGRRRRRPRAAPSAAMTSSTARSSTRTPTRSIIASKKCSPGWASAPRNSTARRPRFPAASSRG